MINLSTFVKVVVIIPYDFAESYYVIEELALISFSILSALNQALSGNV